MVPEYECDDFTDEDFLQRFGGVPDFPLVDTGLDDSPGISPQELVEHKAWIAELNEGMRRDAALRLQEGRETLQAMGFNVGPNDGRRELVTYIKHATNYGGHLDFDEPRLFVAATDSILSQSARR